MNLPRKVLCLAWLSLPLAAQSPANTDLGWPRELDGGGVRFMVYQPQVDRWEKNRLEARSAVMVQEQGASSPVYGIASITARTEVDNESRIVTLRDIKVVSAGFPSVPSSHEKELLETLRQSVPEWPDSISLDRLLADLAVTNAQAETESVPLNNNPPKIFFSTSPAVLLLIDGEPVYRTVPGFSYQRVINTPALLLFDAMAGRFYLEGGSLWMTASALRGPWSVASNPSAALDQAKQEITRTEEKDPHDHSKDAGWSAASNSSPPMVYVSTTPAELIQTKGDPQFSPIQRTKLVYVTNTENNIFLDPKTQDYYTLLSGRWFQAKSLNGPWSFVPARQLPGDFSHIPPDSPKASVLASIPGTPQAKEALLANQVPQTASVKRNQAKLNVRYDGPPQFRPIQGTDMEYAVNTSYDVIHAGGRYYACHNAIWFAADSPMGPWVVADSIPPEIYSIPPSNPLFHDRYVYIYDSNPDFVDFGYTPGYLGAFPSDGVVVFGTGWYYPGWYGDFYYGWPWTWGLGFGYGYWGGGWFWRPVGYPWWYHDYGDWNRIYSEHWNPHWYPGDREAFRNNINVYNRWQPSTLVSRNSLPAPRLSEAGRFSASRPDRFGGGQFSANRDLYAGRDGRVYEHRQNGWYQHNSSGNWNSIGASPELEQQRISRGFGESRWNEYRGFGESPGMLSMPRMSRTYAPSFGRGGFGGGFGGRPGFGGRSGGGIRR